MAGALVEYGNSNTYGGYVIQSGDHLFFRQYQSGGAHGGMQIAFTNGTNSNWSASDSDGNNLNNDGAQQYWHYRDVDLSSFAGRTISKIYLVQETTTSAGSWHIYYNDISLVSADGTVRPIYTRQTSISLTMSGSSGVAGRNYTVDHLTGLGGQPVYTTNYIHSDHLGSSRMVTSTNGYPTYQATLMPYGYDFEQQPTINNYKFTGQERDSETGFDHFMYRQYANNVARWTSPDPAGMGAVDPTNPQTWNQYAYVLGNPMNAVDPLGLCPPDGPANGCTTAYSGNPVSTFYANGVAHSPVEGSRFYQGWELCAYAGSCDNRDTNPSDPASDRNTGSKPPVVVAAQPRWPLNKNSAECQQLAQNIQNKLDQIDKRVDELNLNPLGLPASGPGPRASTQSGHQKIINDLWDQVFEDMNLYAQKCGGGQGSPGGQLPSTIPVSKRGLLQFSVPNWVLPAATGTAAVGCAIFVPGCLEVEAGAALSF